MAELDTSGKEPAKKGKPKKKNPRIDMTPMVDLAFLLLTFFVLTTTLNTPSTLPVIVPPKLEDTTKVEKPKIWEDESVTLLIADRNKVYWYQGVEKPKLQETNFTKSGVRKILVEKYNECKKIRGPKNNFMVLIKIDSSAKYLGMVDALDEMALTDMPRYALVDITKDEREMIKKYKDEMRGAPR